MKLTVLCLLVAVAAAVPLQADSGKDNFETKQKHVLGLLEKIHEPASSPEVSKAAKSFNPVDNEASYKDFDKVKKFIMHQTDGNHRPRHHLFNLFDNDHRSEAVELFEIFMSCKDYTAFFNTASWARERVNEGVFVYAYSVALLNRPDTEGVQLPPLYEINPHFFATTEVIQQAYSAKMRQTPAVIDMGHTGTPYNTEQWVAYFGEDIGFNNHHYHWHADFPFWWKDEYEIKKERKGELFFYTHHQMTNRFDCERLSNYLPKVDALEWDKPIEEGFRPHTTYKYEGEFPFRSDNQYFGDLPFVTIADMQYYEQRIRDGIAQGYAHHTDGHHVNINNTDGINTLGEVIEASDFSVNPDFYGSLHNLAHILLSRVSDPQGKYGLPPGVMEHFETATRDPAFFRLHKKIDNIFKAHKHWLTPYTHDELNFHGVTVTEVSVSCPGHPKNELHTYFEKFQFDLGNALDSSPGVPDVDITASVDRLNHVPFDYTFKVHSNAPHTAVVRVFLAPTYNYYGEMMDDNEQTWLYVEMDRFTAKLQAGDNVITRSSEASSATIPDRMGFKEIRSKLESGELQYEHKKRHCGHPQRLLLPKGTESGMQFTLHVFLSDFEQDKAYDHDPTHNVGNSLSYCGTLNEMYPDKRSMGFPFDRRIDDIDAFLENQNMAYTHIFIKHRKH